MDKVKLLISDSRQKISIFCITESHTNTSIKDSELEIPGYKLERRDRRNGPLGGVLCYIRDDLCYQRRPDLEIVEIESIWIEFLFPKSKPFLVSTVYKPPDGSDYLDENFLSNLDSMLSTAISENKETIITGDLNCDYLEPSDHLDIKNTFKAFGLTQAIKSATRTAIRTNGTSKTLIDIVLTTDYNKIATSIVDANSFSDHDLVGISRKMHVKPKHNSQTIYVRDYSKYNKDSFKEELRKTPWEECLRQPNVNSCWNLFKVFLTNIINKHCPIVSKKLRGKANPWMTKNIKLNMNTRDYYLRRAKRTKNELDWSTYKRMRNRVSHLIRQSKSNYVRSLFRENVNNPKTFWNQIKECYPTKSTEKISQTFQSDDKTLINKREISNKFCSYFVNVGSTVSKSIQSLSSSTWKMFNFFPNLTQCNPSNCSFHFKSVDIADTLKILKEIRSSKSPGVDNIPATLLKDGAEELAAPISLLTDFSFKSGIFPTSEKIAKVTPIYKSGQKNIFCNYRPISVLNIVSKVIEKIAYKQLSDYFENNNLFTPKQFGFRRNRATHQAVTKLTDHIRTNMDNSKLTGVLYMDFSKAFDCVNHACLLSKLPFYGITGIELDWISDYLFNREQQVVYDGTLSDPYKITHGVPQGSILGPLLFIILVNDIGNQLSKCSIMMYADDTVLYYSSKRVSDIESIVNKESSVVKQWVDKNCLALNLKQGKTEFILYGSKLKDIKCNVLIDSTTINMPSSYEYLGITLDNHLNLNEQYQKIYKRICSRIKLLKRVRHNLTPTAAEQIYCSVIKPMYLYCSSIYTNQSNTWKCKFESLHNRARFIVGHNSTTWPTLETERKRKVCIDVFKRLHGIDKISETKYEMKNHRYKTSNNNTLRLPKIKLESGRKTTNYQGASIFNELPSNAREEIYFSKFKRFIKEHNF